MIAAFSFADIQGLQFSASNARMVTFGHWPQVSDSVWLIATVVMPQTPLHRKAESSYR
jgi:hypothetical protein